MELRRLSLLHEFARRGTVPAVADALSYSPSSVSVQLAELEREAGTRLLRKSGRHLLLTPAGMRLRKRGGSRRLRPGGMRLAGHAAAALSADEPIRSELAALSEAPRGTVR